MAREPIWDEQLKALRQGLLKEIEREREVAVRWRAAAPPNATAPLNEVLAQEAEERADRLAALLTESEGGGG